MYSLKLVALAFSFAIPPMVAVGYFIHRDLNTPDIERVGDLHSSGKATEADEELVLLKKFTRAYVAQNAGAPAGMRQGQELAPVAFLNQQLEVNGVKWRVSEVHGMAIETYDVS